ncbi:signal peptidase II [Granulicatella balaenopterae]|uniref:Lipoprotein signal peptidase n=1 Tax=Granulicatella balaenopterae TaxID=137733 RepID=A0A1H9K085_9LACT|nr:signal peptidase II [Granulicatella balaenopterae]SEQ92651.1 signal peptidase II [Granulicatella balaenopterae]
MWIYILVVILGVVIDQLVKFWTVANFEVFAGQGFIPGVVDIFYIRNQGAAWGILEGKMFFFYVITAVAIGALAYLMYHERNHSKLALLAYSLMLSGAVGNFIDRIRLGYVIDMFRLEFVHFPIFNVADALLSIGVAILFIYILFMDNHNGGQNGK